jgi:hypothetical protein
MQRGGETLNLAVQFRRLDVLRDPGIIRKPQLDGHFASSCDLDAPNS